MSVEVEQSGPIATVWLNRPESLNALTVESLTQLEAVFLALTEDESVYVIELAGRGRAFCSGMDKATFESATAVTLEAARVGGFNTIRSIAQSTKITIGAAHGYAIGGGLSIILACDIRLAAPTTAFFIPEVDLGTAFVWGSTPLLVEAVGLARAKELMLTGRQFDAAEAAAMGILTEVPSDVHQRASELATLIASKSPTTLRSIKALANDGQAFREYSLARESELL